MKINIAHFLLLLFLWPAAAQAQDPEDYERNLLKYWKHRQQLTADPATGTTGFLFRAPNSDAANTPGSSIPAAERIPYEDLDYDPTFSGDMNPGPGLIKFSPDGTIALGYYIGVLATEWRLLENAGLTTEADATALELWEALEAYERLDLEAEFWFGQPRELNGFFLRDDVPMGSQALFPIQGSLPGPNQQFLASMASHGTKWRRNPGFVNNDFRSGPSGDQVTFLMLGAALVKALFPTAPADRVVVNGDDLRLKAQMMAHRMFIFLRGEQSPMGTAPAAWLINILNNHPDATPFFFPYKYVLPNGSEPPYGHKHLHVCYGLAESINFIIDNDARTLMPGFFLPDYHDATTLSLGKAVWPIVGEIYDTALVPNQEFCAGEIIADVRATNPTLQIIGFSALDDWLEEMETTYDDDCWNPISDQHMSLVHAWLTMGNLWSGTASMEARASERQLEIHPLLNAIFHGTTLSSAFKDECYRMIDEAPCDKFCVLDDPSALPPGQTFACNNTPEWLSSARWHHPTKSEQLVLGVIENREHNGLDFLLFFNCYHLAVNSVWPGYGPAYIGENREIDFDMPVPFANLNFYSQAESPQRPIWAWESMTSTSDIQAVTPGPDPANGSVSFRAGEVIRLLPGFKVEQGAEFRAFIDDFECDVNDEINKQQEGDLVETDSQESEIAFPSEARLTVYPNPNSGHFRMELEGLEGTSEVMVINAVGQVIWQETMEPNQEYEVNLQLFSAGVFTVRVRNGDQTLTKRVVKQ